MAARQVKLEKSQEPFDSNAKQTYMETIANMPEIKRDMFEYQKALSGLRCNTSSTLEAAEQYELFSTVDNKDVLIIKRIRCQNVIEIVSHADSFDLLTDVHLATDHGGKETMLKFMRQKYYVSPICLDVFLDLCNVCKEHRKTGSDNRLNSSATVSLLDFSLQKDGDFGFILVYISIETGFTLLRPITTMQVEKEVAMELFNIFLDLGPPNKIIFNAKHFNMFQSALKQMKMITYHFNINLVDETDTVDSDLFIIDKLNAWMNRSSSNSWSLACHLIQWKMNNSRPIGADHAASYGSPYEAIFNNAARYIEATSDENVAVAAVANEEENVAAVANEEEKEIEEKTIEIKKELDLEVFVSESEEENMSE